MAQAVVTDARFTRIWVGDAPGDLGPPPAYKLCAMDSKTFNQAVNTNTAVIPDCDDPTVVAPVRQTPVSIEKSIEGTGYFESANRALLQDFLDNAVAQNCCFEIMTPDPNPGYYTGSFYMTRFNIIGNNDDGYITAEVTFVASGAVTWFSL
jgi:hypothetical protein